MLAVAVLVLEDLVADGCRGVHASVQRGVVLAGGQRDDLGAARDEVGIAVGGVVGVAASVLGREDGARRLVAELHLVLHARRQTGEGVVAVTRGDGVYAGVTHAVDQAVRAAADQRDGAAVDASSAVVLQTVAVGVHPQAVTQAGQLRVAPGELHTQVDFGAPVANTEVGSAVREDEFLTRGDGERALDGLRAGVAVTNGHQLAELVGARCQPDDVDTAVDIGLALEHDDAIGVFQHEGLAGVDREGAVATVLRAVAVVVEVGKRVDRALAEQARVHRVVVLAGTQRDNLAQPGYDVGVGVNVVVRAHVGRAEHVGVQAHGVRVDETNLVGHAGHQAREPVEAQLPRARARVVASDFEIDNGVGHAVVVSVLEQLHRDAVDTHVVDVLQTVGVLVFPDVVAQAGGRQRHQAGIDAAVELARQKHHCRGGTGADGRIAVGGVVGVRVDVWRREAKAVGCGELHLILQARGQAVELVIACGFAARRARIVRAGSSDRGSQEQVASVVGPAVVEIAEQRDGDAVDTGFVCVLQAVGVEVVPDEVAEPGRQGGDDQRLADAVVDGRKVGRNQAGINDHAQVLLLALVSHVAVTAARSHRQQCLGHQRGNRGLVAASDVAVQIDVWVFAKEPPHRTLHVLPNAVGAERTVVIAVEQPIDRIKLVQQGTVGSQAGHGCAQDSMLSGR